VNCRGFTLTELLVALALTSTLTVGGLAALAQARNTWRDAGIESRLHERAQYVFASLEPELQMAGYFGAGGPVQALEPSTIPTSALSCGLELVRRLDVAVAVHPRYDLPCTPLGGGAREDSQLLVLRRISSQVAAAEPGRAQWWATPSGAGVSGLQWNGLPPPGATPEHEARDVLVRAYYISRTADGDPATPALRMKSLSSITGAPAFIDTEVMPGVESMQIESFPSAQATTSVQVSLRIRADHDDLRRGEPASGITVTRRFTLRNVAKR
jgi:prepilin-type N-terminal cleavage/methylation domain-containing protein